MASANLQVVLVAESRRAAANRRKKQKILGDHEVGLVPPNSEKGELELFGRKSESSAMRAPAVISDHELSEAEGIHTFDPTDPNAAGHQLWGNKTQESAAQINADSRIVEIPLSSDDHVALLALISRIEKVKGKLLPDVEVLRTNYLLDA
jgi:hypothetical protein